MDYRNIMLVGLVLSFGCTVSGQNCSALLSKCKASIKLVPDSWVTATPSSEINQCDTIESMETACNSYKNFWLCVNNTMASCNNDSVTTRELTALRYAYDGQCTGEVKCGTMIGKCDCSSGVYTQGLSFPRSCKNLGLFKDCLGKISDCEGSGSVQQADAFVNMTESICKTACPESFICWMGSFSHRQPDSSRFSEESENICRNFLPRLQCLTASTKSCSASLSDKWNRTEASYLRVCEAFPDDMTDPSPCSSIQRCIDKVEVIKGITLDRWQRESELFLPRAAEFVTAMMNPGTWCSVLMNAMECVVHEADTCSLNATEKAEAVAAQSFISDSCKGTNVNEETREPASGFGKTGPCFTVYFLMAVFGLSVL